MTIKHSSFTSGDACPSCHAHQSRGKLYPIEPGVILRLVGQPLITGTKYVQEKWRCHLCQTLYKATVPKAIVNQPKYDASCSATLAFARYYMGQPFHRIERWQSIYGIPLADSTQWDHVYSLYQVVKPVIDELEKLAAESSLFHYDDTPNRILFPDNVTGRKGIYTTAIVAEYLGHPIHLFYTSARHAGDNMTALLSERHNQDDFYTMSDALGVNRLKHLPSQILEAWICCFCLVHGRRKFFELFHFFDVQVDFVLKVIGTVYHHEKHCKQAGLDPGERLAYHQEHSAPQMNALNLWLVNQRRYALTEPNSHLGQAINYLLKHWRQLTRFLHRPGAPIDNSLCERTIKVVIRHRRNSLFFRTSQSAQVGDGLTSLIHTTVRQGINPIDYLVALQHHRQRVEQAPEQWLPWCYTQQLAA